MKCEIVKDLLPLYIDNICSKESVEEIEEHLKSCESCQATLKNYKAEIEVEKEVAFDLKDIDPFKKLRADLKRVRITNIVLGTILSLIAIIIGLLSIGEFTESDFIPSFNTVRASLDAKSKTELLLDGNIKAYMSDVVADENAAEAIQEFFNMYLESKTIEYKVSDIGYGGVKANNRHNPIAEIQMFTDDGSEFRVQYIFTEGGVYLYLTSEDEALNSYFKEKLNPFFES